MLFSLVVHRAALVAAANRARLHLDASAAADRWGNGWLVPLDAITPYWNDG